ncbi:ribonuclease H [Senna tora]|uniref:Ribonuclease H n=1 Tax=Senna tora TaxID=362788 RepID=A0A834X560_9FABA|nr:ribonuclease H [Senna tora]
MIATTSAASNKAGAYSWNFMTLKIDPTTSITTRGKFARISVEINLKKKLIPHVVIRGRCYSVEYEGLHLICFHCGKYGHQKGQCSELKRQDTSAGENEHPSTMSDNMVVRQGGQERASVPEKGGRTDPSQGAEKGNDAELGKNEMFGPWMLPKKPNRRRNNVPRKSGVIANQGARVNGMFTKGVNQSRFDVLGDLDSEENHIQPQLEDVNATSRAIVAGTSVSTKGRSEVQLVTKPIGSRPHAVGGQSPSNKQIGVVAGKQAQLGLKSNWGLIKPNTITQVGNHEASRLVKGKQSMMGPFVNPGFALEQESRRVDSGIGPSSVETNRTKNYLYGHTYDPNRTTSQQSGEGHPSKPPDLNIEYMDVSEGRGTGSKTFPGLVRDIKHRHDVDFLALVETKQSGDKATEIVKKLGFDGSEQEEAVGFVGGIWCLWRKDRVSVSIILKHPQFIHLKINKGARLVPHSGAVAGDFNAFLYDHEKCGGSSGGSRPDQGFRDWVDSCAMLDMGFSGNKFTWSRRDVSIRLDRVLVNQSWRLLFPEAGVVHLPRFKSDHHPLWLRIDPSLNSRQRHDRPFRFLAAWVTHESFPNVVKKAWKCGTSWHTGLQDFYEGVKGWNKKEFGNIFANKESLMNKIQSIEGQLARRPNIHLKEARERLWRDYERVQNSAFMAKLGWGLIYNRDTLWTQVLRHKYGCGDDILPRVSMGSNPSRIWRGIAKNWNHVENGLRWRIGDGTNIKFWLDSWVPNCQKLCDLVIGPISESDLMASVQMFLYGGIRRMVTFQLSPVIMLSGGVSEARDSNWKSIWKLHVPQRVRSFMWLLMHEKLLTNVERCRRRIADSTVCDRCGGISEDIIHALRDCNKAKDIWLRLVKPSSWPEFFHLDLRDWISLNLHSNLGVFDLSWKEVFATTCWSMWRRRNEQVFNQRDFSVTDPVFTILQQVRMASEAYRDVLSTSRSFPSRSGCLVRWSHPEEEWLKVNVDGACKSSTTERASCGGVIRDHEGRFLLGFAKNLGYCDVISAELWGIKLGLEVAWEMGARKIVIETDSTYAHQLVLSRVQKLHPCLSLVNAIHQILARQWEVQIVHVLREANRVADFFASCATHESLDLVKFVQPPPDATHLISADANGIGTIRGLAS